MPMHGFWVKPWRGKWFPRDFKPRATNGFVRYALGSGLGWAGSWLLPRFLDRCHLSYSDGSNLIKSEAGTKCPGRVQMIVTAGPSEGPGGGTNWHAAR